MCKLISGRVTIRHPDKRRPVAVQERTARRNQTDPNKRKN
ncbi:MAG: hypothetical protein K0S31_3662 [Sphingobacterium multivorum]|jgi:hypothetical protein|nr:hypothetical protein [Sphingobacterium multivorum]